MQIRGSINAIDGRAALQGQFPPIRFGTDGWRGRIAEEITLAGMRRCAAGAAAHLLSAGKAGSPIAIGYDGRFLSERFAAEVAAVMAREGFVPLLSPEPLPTPALSLRVVTGRASLGIMITASHNPPEYGGLKLKDSDGGTMDPESTESIVRSIPAGDPGSAGAPDLPRHPSFLPSYLRAVKQRVAIREIRSARLKILADSMHGMGGTLLEQAASGGKLRVRTLRSDPDPLFGGTNPEPIAPHLQPLRRAVVSERAAAGFATDGDADRIGACDDRGRFLSPLTLLPVLALHFIRNRGERGGIAKTFAGSLRMERIARSYGLAFHELPVGFKHIARLLRKDEILLGGEESGGFGFRGFIPERDGILSSLLLLEALVFSDLPLSGLVAGMEKEYGKYFFDRTDLSCTPEAGRRLVAKLSDSPPKRVAGMKVTSVDRLDGVKLVFGEDGWLLFRPSGTEPILRLYCEAPTRAAVAAALSHALRLLKR
ncbi:MAG TPA: phosphoglucomutase/phosphomannomutase family protein [Candidatus Polarisedimenticolia bacterium]|jgi:phosphomannomutase|nr:phosphoglucomutase/phosphomannomutase family protein [Candidatus Polarisedimenticolia bacterium]